MLFFHVFLGDGRNDSPGYNAQYLQYTVMEETTGDILGISFTDKRQTGLKSPYMEPLGLRNVLKDLNDSGLLQMLIPEFHQS